MSFAGRVLPAGFRARSLRIGVGREVAFDRAAWTGALVVVERGRIELETVDGSCARFERGAVLYLERLPLRRLRTVGTTPVVLAGVSRCQPVGTVGESSGSAIRAVVRGDVQDVGFRDATLRRARALGLSGWVRNGEDGAVLVHAEGPAPALEELVAFLQDGPQLAGVAAVATETVPVEGHEQFAIRGVSAGVFVIQEHAATTRHFDLRLEVAGVMRSWALPRGPSLDPAVKRLAVEVPDHAIDRNTFEAENVIVWDRGTYEQGGRVAWPQALDRGHAVFVLHGQKLSGGFALQRTRGGDAPQWLLIKRRDEAARPGSDVVEEQPQSVLSGRRLNRAGETAASPRRRRPSST